MKIVKCIQGSDEWWEYHRGRPTASSFDRIITPKKGDLSSQSEDYIAELVAQRLLPGLKVAPENYISRAMLDGIQLEPEARNWYQLERDIHVEQVGICLTDCGRFGASPDALIPKIGGGGHEGGLELKCPTPKVHVGYLVKGILPDEYRCQVHGELWVTGLPWFDFVSYCPGLPPFIVRVTPDAFTAKMGLVLEQFYKNFETVLARFPRETTNDFGG